MRRYREYVYEAGAISHSSKPNARTIQKDVLKKARQKNFKPTRVERFLSRTRYFTDSGVIGSKAFVSETFNRFQEFFQNPGKRIPKPVQRIDGVYALKRLCETL